MAVQFLSVPQANGFRVIVVDNPFFEFSIYLLSLVSLHIIGLFPFEGLCQFNSLDLSKGEYIVDVSTRMHQTRIAIPNKTKTSILASGKIQG
jgi:hypothetical protein